MFRYKQVKQTSNTRLCYFKTKLIGEIILKSCNVALLFTFTSFLFKLHLPAVLLQLLVGEFGEGVGPLLADDNLGLILLFDDCLGCSHQFTLQNTEKGRRRESTISRSKKIIKSTYCKL